ncbi:MAG: hypothetical protein CMH83_14860 [Nocardioides sp.]|nr:hypothetical protein [Nocardioides sp.]
MGAAPLEPELVAAYGALVHAGALDAAGLATAVAVDLDEAQRLLGALEDHGLLSRRVGSAPATYVPAPPAIALGAVLAEQQHAVHTTQKLVEQLDEVYRRTGPTSHPSDVVDLVVGTAAVRARIQQIQTSAREEVLSLVKPPVAVVSSEDNAETEDAAVDRGVRYRAVLETSMLEEEPRLLHAVAAAAARGEEARLSPSVPIKLFVVDRSVALVPLGHAGTGTGPEGALLVRGSGLLDALIALFELVWERAFEIAPGTAESGAPEPSRLAADSPTDLDREILTLLLAGLTDEAVAKGTGTSVRTVQRRVRALMDGAGVVSRLQLGWVAHERGWLGAATPQRA